MAAFPTMTLTNAGQALQTKVQAGATLAFTRIALGDGQLNGQPISPLTALISQKASVEVDTVRVVDSSTAQATLTLPRASGGERPASLPRTPTSVRSSTAIPTPETPGTTSPQ